jgi:hypothetical protein
VPDVPVTPPVTGLPPTPVPPPLATWPPVEGVPAVGLPEAPTPPVLVALPPVPPSRPFDGELSEHAAAAMTKTEPKKTDWVG